MILGNLARGAIAVLLLGAQGPAWADDGREARVCAKALKAAQKSNTTQLWLGADLCKLAGELDDSAFLLFAGRVRAGTDLNALKAASDQDKLETYDISKRLTASGGYVGEYEVYRDPERRKRLMQRLRAFKPSLDEEYDPGWDYKTSVTVEKYEQVLACQKALREQELENFAKLINDDEYFAARKEFDELAPVGLRELRVKSSKAQQLQTALARVRDAAANVELSRSQPEACAFTRHYEPDPDAEFTQIFSGWNGPSTGGGSAFDSEEKVRESWIAKALTPEELESVLSQVDFDRQILVALGFGKQTAATGKVYITTVDHNAISSSFRVIGRAGVNEADCEEPHADSYPFALAVTERPKEHPRRQGASMSEFPDGCKPVKGAAATEASAAPAEAGKQ